MTNIKLTPTMLQGLASAVETPGGVTTTAATIDALVRRGLIRSPGRVYGQRTMYATAQGEALIESLGGPDEARKRSYEGVLEVAS